MLLEWSHRREERMHRRMDWRFAALYALTINANPFRDPSAEPAKPEDFMPRPEPSRKERDQVATTRALVEFLKFESDWAEREARRKGAKLRN